MYNLFKNIVCLLLINILANASPLEGCLILILMYYKFTDDISVLQLKGLALLVVIIHIYYSFCVCWFYLLHIKN